MGQQGEGGGELFELPTSVRKLLGAFVGGTLLPGVPVTTMFPGEVDFPKWKRFFHSLAMSESPFMPAGPYLGWEFCGARRSRGPLSCTPFPR